MANSFKDSAAKRVVLVTGASAGIGRAIVRGLLADGWTVYGGARRLDHMADLASLGATVRALDVTDEASMTDFVDAVLSAEGCIDALVNNAGIVRSGSVEGLALDDFKAVMETNYFGALRTIRAWLPHLRAQRGGCIVNVTSVAGRIACSPLAPYAAAKFALEALSEVLAQELRPFNVRVAIVQPGIIDTAMAREVKDVAADRTYPQVRRFGDMFAAALDAPTPPSAVAAKILEIIDSGTLTLRHPVGPGAEGFLGWRASMTDDDWVTWGALTDDAWYDRVGSDFGLDARSKRRVAAVHGA